MSVVKTEKELSEALKRGDNTIEIEGSLADKTIKIRATGDVAWLVAIGAIGVAVALTIGSGGSAAPVAAAFAAPAAVGVLGVGATTAAISIAIAAGGVGALTSLRGYKEISRSKNKLILKKK